MRWVGCLPRTCEIVWNALRWELPSVALLRLYYISIYLSPISPETFLQAENTFAQLQSFRAAFCLENIREGIVTAYLRFLIQFCEDLSKASWYFISLFGYIMCDWYCVAENFIKGKLSWSGASWSGITNEPGCIADRVRPGSAISSIRPFST